MAQALSSTRWMVSIMSTVLLVLAGCSPEQGGPRPTATRPAWALAIHGGAGNVPRDLETDRRAAYQAGLEEALRAGAGVLAAGGAAVDAVEQVVVTLEENDLFNAGRGAVFSRDGMHHLQAGIMSGRDRSCGAVAGLTTVRNPIRLARAVMEHSDTVFMAGLGAEDFAAAMGLELVDHSFFDTPVRREQLERALKRRAEEGDRGTVGAVALDVNGDLAAATSSGGRTAQHPGRVGDVPVIGAGTFADNRSCAVSATGTGEQFIRHTAASAIAVRVAERGMPLEQAAREVIFGVLDEGDGGVITVDRDGSIAMVFSTAAMFRGAADAAGRFEVAIWD